jgi:hypothetical protein
MTDKNETMQLSKYYTESEFVAEETFQLVKIVQLAKSNHLLLPLILQVSQLIT